MSRAGNSIHQLLKRKDTNSIVNPINQRNPLSIGRGFETTIFSQASLHMVADWKQDLDQCRTKNRELIDLKGADTIDAQKVWLQGSVMG